MPGTVYLYISFINLEKFLSGGSCFPLEIQAIWQIKLENEHSYIHLNKTFVSNQFMTLDKSLPFSVSQLPQKEKWETDDLWSPLQETSVYLKTVNNENNS